MYENIPEELKSVPNWVCWQASPDPRPDDPNHLKKTPINPRTGGGAMSNNPDTWADYDTALKASERFSGIGFMFGNSPYFGVDVDKVESDIREYLEGGAGIVSEFMNGLQSYSELSPSGKGIHIICKGTLPKRGRRRGNVEMYESGRFFTVTGNSFGDYATIRDCTERIKPLHEKYIGGGLKEPAPKSHNLAPLPTTAGEIVALATKAKNGALFTALFGGDISGYNSQSEADMALCNMLAFWCRCDAEMMDTIFRQSGLMRDKWDRAQSGSTYGALTIQKAIADCENVYEPRSSAKYRVNITGDDGEEQELSVRKYTFDDTGNAERFVDLFGEDMRYNYTDKCWIFWDGRCWCTDYDGAAARVADKCVEAMAAEGKVYAAEDEETGGDMFKQFSKHVKYTRSHKGKKAFIEEAQHRLPIMAKDLDRHLMALNTPNGTITLKNGALLDHNKAWQITRMTTVEFTDKADHPLWDKFLLEVFEGDIELIRYVQKAVGYSLTGRTDEQCAFFLFGTGRNGKTTFLDVIRDIAGDYAMNVQPETLMVRSNQSTAVNSDIARLKGARLVTSVEPNEGMRINEGLLKQLTGDDTVTARKLYANEFEFKPEFKLWMATNHKPIIRGTDTGIWRRIHMIPFTAQIPPEKVDKQLKDKLRAEYPAILRWAVDGCLLWQSEGLGMPLAVKEMVREYRREMDVLTAFIEDRCEVGDGKYEKASALYGAYSAWCDANNEYKMSNTKFGIEIAKRYKKVARPDGNYYIGLALWR